MDDLIVRARKVRLKRRGTISLLAVVALVGAFVPIVLIHHGPRSARFQPTGPVLPSGVPAMGAVPSTLKRAESTMPFSISRPSDPLANDAVISKVWTSPYGIVVIQYSTGIELMLDSEEPPPPNPLQALQNVADSFPGATIIYLGADPALAMVQNNPGNGCPQTPGEVCVPAQNNPGSVTFWRDQIQIRILGYYSTDILGRIAITMP